MKVDFDKGVEDLKGQVIVDETGAELTVQTLLYQAATATFQDDKLSNRDAMDLYAIAKKVVDKSDLSLDELAKLKGRFEKLPWPIVVKGRIIEILEG